MKATLCRPSSTAVLAPRQNLAPLISIPTKFLFGNFSASPTEYSPFPQPNSRTNGFSFLKKSEFHFPFKGNDPETTSSLVGWKTFVKVSFSLNLFSLFLLPTVILMFWQKYGNITDHKYFYIAQLLSVKSLHIN